MKKLLTSGVLLLCCTFLHAQWPDPLAASYASDQNPHYWKNKKPHASYWQQDVHYRMKLELNEQTDILAGQSELYYVNHSPDTLHFVYFHLYQNAFQPGSYYDQLLESNKTSYPFGSVQQQGLGINVDEISSEGVSLKTEKDNTILKVWLHQPLLPGGTAHFSMRFTTWFDITAPWGRMRVYEWYGNKHYNGGHFYPRLAVYDYRSGWDTDQHLGHEFYGDFGTYSVELSIAANFVVDATGVLQNKEDVMPDELRKKLDVSNFKDKPLYSDPSVIIPYDPAVRKTWKFQASGVHDFAFLADPTYRIGEAEWNGVKCVALVAEPHAARWQDAAELTADIIRIYSEDFGMYAYPKMIVSDARSGMEYPMLTMDNGLSPDYTYLFAHEIGHNWFFGMVGSNETYQAALDEGFTQFMTIRALERLKEKRAIDSPDNSRFFEKNTRKDPIRYDAAYDSYLDNALKTPGVTLNTHSDMFLTTQNYGSEYRQTYNKTAVMLFNLQYVLGDERFAEVMKHYFHQWSFCHPYLDDFRQSVNQYTNTNFNWFFDQWLETTKTIDYSVRSIRRTKDKGTYRVRFHRKGFMQMPIDFTVVCRNDSVYSFHIPNTDYVKNTSARVLQKWVGWNRFNRTYDAEIIVSDKIRNVVIDSTRRLADLNLYNNSHRRPVTANFDYLFEQAPDWTRYEFYGRPDLWYNGYDGLKVGFHLDGAYMKHQHIFELAAWINTRLFQQPIKEDMFPYSYNRFSFRMQYRTPVKWLSQNTWLDFHARSLDGVNAFKLAVEKHNRSGNAMIAIGVKSMFLFGKRSLTYMMYPNEWSYEKEGGTINYNNILYGNVTHNYQKKTCLGSLDFMMKTSAFGNGYDYTTFAFTHKHRQKMWRFFLNTRFFIQYAVGSQLPDESALYLAGSNPESLLDYKFTRSFGFFPQSWGGYGTGLNHFHAGGGLNLRAYSGYLVAQELSDGTVIPVYKGNSGAAINAELDLDRLVTFRPRFTREWLRWNLYLFGDAGVINYNQPSNRLKLADIRADAGVGTALTIKKWGRFDKIKPFTIRFDVPLFMNRPPAVDGDYFRFRWIVGINRAF
jgi:hypothetical protein